MQPNLAAKRRAFFARAERAGLSAAVKDDAAELFIYDEIGFFGVTASDVAAVLGTIKTGTIVVRINSPGGDVFDGIAIYNALRQHGAKIEVRVDGLAASAASIIAMAGETIAMAKGSMMMIHDPWSIVVGNAAEMRAYADIMDKVADQLVAIYVDRTGKDAKDVKAIMAAETWYSAEEAQAAGFADQIEGQAKAFAGFDLSVFAKAPSHGVKPDADVPTIRHLRKRLETDLLNLGAR